MLRFFAICTYIGGFFAVFTLLAGIADDSAPRAAARAGIAIALVTIPYCITKIFWMSRQVDQFNQVQKHLFRMNTLLENAQLPPKAASNTDDTPAA